MLILYNKVLKLVDKYEAAGIISKDQASDAKYSFANNCRMDTQTQALRWQTRADKATSGPDKCSVFRKLPPATLARQKCFCTGSLNGRRNGRSLLGSSSYGLVCTDQDQSDAGSTGKWCYIGKGAVCPDVHEGEHGQWSNAACDDNYWVNSDPASAIGCTQEHAEIYGCAGIWGDPITQFIPGPCSMFGESWQDLGITQVTAGEHVHSCQWTSPSGVGPGGSYVAPALVDWISIVRTCVKCQFCATAGRDKCYCPILEASQLAHQAECPS